MGFVGGKSSRCSAACFITAARLWRFRPLESEALDFAVGPALAPFKDFMLPLPLPAPLGLFQTWALGAIVTPDMN